MEETTGSDLLLGAYGWQPNHKKRTLIQSQRRQLPSNGASVVVKVGNLRLRLYHKTKVSVGYRNHDNSCVDTPDSDNFMSESKNDETILTMTDDPSTFHSKFDEMHIQNATPRRVSESTSTVDSFELTDSSNESSSRLVKSICQNDLEYCNTSSGEGEVESREIISSKKQKQGKRWRRLTKWRDKRLRERKKTNQLANITNMTNGGNITGNSYTTRNSSRRNSNSSISKRSTKKKKRHLRGTTPSKNTSDYRPPKRKQTSSIMKLPPSDTMIRRHYNIGWFDGKLITSEPNASQAYYDDGQLEDIQDDEEVLVGAAAYLIKYHATHKKRHIPTSIGTQVRKKFDDFWYTGQVIAHKNIRDTKKKSYRVKYQEDSDEEDMLEEEVKVCAIAYQLSVVPAQCEDMLFTLVGGGDGSNCAPVQRTKRRRRSSNTCSPVDPTPTATSTASSSKRKNSKLLKEIESFNRVPFGTANTDIVLGKRRSSQRQSTAPRQLETAKNEATIPRRKDFPGKKFRNILPTSSTRYDARNQAPLLAGTKLRKRFLVKTEFSTSPTLQEWVWYDGEVINISQRNLQTVCWSDGQKEQMDELELQVAMQAYKMYANPSSSNQVCPGSGTRIRRHYSDGWYDGSIVNWDCTGKCYVLFDDGDEAFLDLEEARLLAWAYDKHYGLLPVQDKDA